jgi:hypothetical protein
MTNLEQVKRKAIKVELADGKEREIKFTLNAMAELEEKYGSVDDAFKVLEGGSLKAIRFFLWATIQQEEKEDLSEKQLGDLIDISSIGNIINAMNEASSQDMPQDADVVATAEATVVDPN